MSQGKKAVTLVPHKFEKFYSGSNVNWNKVHISLTDEEDSSAKLMADLDQPEHMEFVISDGLIFWRRIHLIFQLVVAAVIGAFAAYVLISYDSRLLTISSIAVLIAVAVHVNWAFFRPHHFEIPFHGS